MVYVELAQNRGTGPELMDGPSNLHVRSLGQDAHADSMAARSEPIEKGKAINSVQSSLLSQMVERSERQIHERMGNSVQAVYAQDSFW